MKRSSDKILFENMFRKGQAGERDKRRAEKIFKEINKKIEDRHKEMEGKMNAYIEKQKRGLKEREKLLEKLEATFDKYKEAFNGWAEEHGSFFDETAKDDEGDRKKEGALFDKCEEAYKEYIHKRFDLADLDSTLKRYKEKISKLKDILDKIKK